MKKNPYAPALSDLPKSLPVFPLSGVLLLPGGNLPLNIFEPRYVAMVETAMAGGRMIGMIQPADETSDAKAPPLKAIGCAGKIVEFHETTDGRYVINLNGISRFRVAEELESHQGFRQVRPEWSAFENDLSSSECLGLDREKLIALLRFYFQKEQMNCEWSQIENANDGKLITCLSMICPFDAQDKQALLEADDCKARAALFMTMLDQAVHNAADAESQTQH